MAPVDAVAKRRRIKGKQATGLARYEGNVVTRVGEIEALGGFMGRAVSWGCGFIGSAATAAARNKGGA